MRKDRLSHDHGGVCVYIKEDIKYKIVEELMCCDVHEVLWIKLNPARLPRGFSCVILAVVYYPGPTSPAECDAQLILNHLFDSLMKAQSLFSNCGLVVTGDFNRLKTSRLQNHFKDVRAHCYCASLVRTLFIGHARATSFSSARTESKT